MPFREAHAVVGGLVRESIERACRWPSSCVADPRLGADGAALLEPGARCAGGPPGGGGPDPVAEQLERFRRRIDIDSARLA